MKEKIRILNYPLIIMGLVLMLTGSCKKKDEVPPAPSLTTIEVSEITRTTATGGGLIGSASGTGITERGVCWSTGDTPTTADSKAASTTNTVNFSCPITGLSAGTTYHVRAYAINSSGTGYGTAVTFTTLPAGTPVVTTTAPSEFTETTATSGGNVTADGGAAVTARGVCWGTSATPTIDDNKTTDGSATGSFTSAITGLKGGTIYYVRAYATNSSGTAYGTALSFSTLPAPGVPILTTSAVSDKTGTTATCGGTITSVGGSAITASGVCWSTSAAPTIADSKTTDGSTTGSFTSAITGLDGETTYYVRAYATNSTGTGYGDAVSFTTLVAPITDYDGNVYTKVTIGSQVWMVEELKTTHYNDGEAIPNVTGNADWAALTTAAYCWQNNDKVTFPNAAYYNWYAVSTGKLCPKGWHVPSNEDYTKLTDGLGGQALAGGPLKATTGWDAPNTGATNSTGFSAMPVGYRYEGGAFAGLGGYASWYTSTEFTDPAQAYQWWAAYNDTNFSQSSVKKAYGSPVRCIKN